MGNESSTNSCEILSENKKTGR